MFKRIKKVIVLDPSCAEEKAKLEAAGYVVVLAPAGATVYLVR